jgi:hypothetical protein
VATKIQRNEVNFKGKMMNIGIDVHKRSWRITALVEGLIVMAVTLSRPKIRNFKENAESV